MKRPGGVPPVGRGGGTSVGRRPVVIGNRRSRGLWWRLPCVLLAWAILASPIAAGLSALGILRGYARDLPAEPDLDRWRAGLPATSVIAAADGTLLAEIPFRASQAEVGHRLWVSRAELPTVLIQALLAAEDIRFFEHHGVDPHAVVRAAWTNYQAGRVLEGASTITQQVARALLPDEIGHQETLRRKVREALVARRLEARFSKSRILEAYANQIFLGAGAYGVAAAARAYFSRPLGRLDVAQAALVAGLAQAPGRIDPYRDPAAARARRDEVLERMRRAGFLTEPQFQTARARPLELRRPMLRYGSIAPWYTERARRETELGLPADYSRGGLVVETAAAPALAREVETRAVRYAARLAPVRGSPVQVAVLVLDHATGYVEATVGGLGWDRTRFDRSTQACRQPGSAFKPLVYAAALAADAITPGTALRDGPVAAYDEKLDVHWKPRNSGRAFRGVALAQDALASSLNAPAIDVLDRVGGRRVIELARRLGITTPIDDVRPMVLGASCMVPIELAGAFATFAQGGRTAAPIFVVRVRRGAQVLFDRASPHDPWIDPTRRLDRLAATAGGDPGPAAIDPQTAYMITAMLRDVVLRGTATGARTLGRPAAGKTGTTNDNSDAWFVGFTARLVAAVWVGHDDPSRLLGPRQDGAHAALPLWVELARLAEGARTPRPVPADPPPPGLVRARVDRETGLLAAPAAGGAIDLWFRRGTEPRSGTTDAPGVPLDLSRAAGEF